MNVALFGREISATAARDVAGEVARAIRDGRLPAGTRLPTVRAVAGMLGVSSGSIAAAWTKLRGEGLIATNRRGGTIVTFDREADYAPSSAAVGWTSVDLSSGIADPALQMPLADALIAGAQASALNAPALEAIAPALLEAVRPSWPFPAEAFMTAAGGSEGISLALDAATRSGDTIAVEQPTSPRILEMASARGLNAIGVGCDDEGPTPAELARALRRKPVAFVYQPRAHIPLGHTVGAERISALADVLRAHREVVVIEDDNVGPIAEQPCESIGIHLPDRTLHMRAYCRTYGVDLRTSVLGGAAALINRALAVRTRGYVMQSRILQNAMAHLMTNPQSQHRLAHARRRYAWRRTTLIKALAGQGIEARNRDGIMVWIPVDDERAALVNLASYGIAAGAGSKCFIDPPPQSHLRIATSRLPDDRRLISQLAKTIARAVVIGGQQNFD
jgi:DNA-binding transcriptional MocR family regulator